VTKGFEKRLTLVGRRVPRAGPGRQAQFGARLFTSGGAPDAKGIKVVTPTQTEIVISGGRQAAGGPGSPPRFARSARPSPTKGKGVRYSGEIIILKETKKK